MILLGASNKRKWFKKVIEVIKVKYVKRRGAYAEKISYA